MENNLMNMIPFDPAYIILGMVGVIALLFILVIVCLVKMSGLKKKYNRFMEGSSAASLEELIQEEVENIRLLDIKEKEISDKVQIIEKLVSGCYQKVGIEKYDAMTGMGGKVSFAFALLDFTNDGILMNSIHTREGSYLYMKEITNGKCELTLGKEEQAALDQAIAVK